MTNFNLLSATVDRRILFGIAGGIAAYKACAAISALAKSGIQVRGIMTSGAVEFITPLTVSTLCRHPAYVDADFWRGDRGKPLHIDLAEWAEVMVIAPLTANTLAKLAWGMADNLLTNVVLASTCPVLLAPAMNTHMWQQQTTQRNWQQVLSDPRYHALAPTAGVLACDTVGTGRMAEPEDIVTHLHSLLLRQGDRDWDGKRVLISAGGTREHLDPVRCIGNPATGKMGVALAQAAHHRGADVTLVCGVMEVPAPAYVRAIHVTSAAQMHAALLAQLPEADVIFMAAAVGDVRPSKYSSIKLPKQSLGNTLPLEPVPDILADLAERKQPHQRSIGFAAQTGDIIPPALDKLQRKHLDAIAANPIDLPDAGFGADTNQAVWLSAVGDRVDIPLCS
ncbi:MAG: bifunctional phosphopantothenoylcysteine decarboxylase/phosphopantothenate--cysteine ligase CoaBC, partial [Coleofasciculaceae cyanobacterium SM2_3_26]|nr:bifunctional phosphopantothenoylcysteine decarboxylase/phosphopantothenate--cysteine ligase CoaBC [Coleofasciculaceae cyanobacterium SM2_3_26]